MSQEGWTYLEGFYFSFVTLTTIGFGDLVAGVEPNKEYPALYRYFVEVWIYLGLAWLSLFFNWKVRMVIEAHKALKKRRRLRKLSLDELQYYKKSQKAAPHLPPTPNDVNIFGFLSKKQEGYNDLIKQIGSSKDGRNGSRANIITKSKVARSKSCSENQLDKHVDLEDGAADYGLDGQRGSDCKEYQPLNANITFVDENFLTNNLNDDDDDNDDSKGKLSIATCEENIEVINLEDQSSESEGLVFTSDASENSRSYDQLVEEYTKEENIF
uniref:Potassium channel, subfamily K, member 5a n=1 Tax=Takifugu rubripes TaxID=31033 RepID=A0A674N772_TAKRU